MSREKRSQSARLTLGKKVIGQSKSQMFLFIMIPVTYKLLTLLKTGQCAAPLRHLIKHLPKQQMFNNSLDIFPKQMHLFLSFKLNLLRTVVPICLVGKD